LNCAPGGTPPSSAPTAENCLIIAGQVAEASPVRTTPAGVRIGRFLLDHHSGQTEAGLAREVRCRIPVVACGEPLARLTEQLAPGVQVRVQGFVGRANYREERGLVLHAARIDVLPTE
jgi:primosomal replication protein N